MEPTIYSDDILMTEHITPRFKQLERGDVVIAKSPSNHKQNICKRITGLPGDKIKIGFNDYTIVPRGHVWLEGDNFKNSSDSRDYGPVPQGLIRSRAVCKIWPISDIGVISR